MSHTLSGVLVDAVSQQAARDGGRGGGGGFVCRVQSQARGVFFL